MEKGFKFFRCCPPLQLAACMRLWRTYMHVLVSACHLADMSVTVHCLQSQAVVSFLSLKRPGPDDAMSYFILRNTKMVHNSIKLARR